MKLVLAIINHDDAHVVVHNLTKEGFLVTKLSTTGGFLMVGNMTVLIGVPDEKVNTVIKIIDKYSKSRKQVMPSMSEIGMELYPSMPVEVTVGGATVFVLNVERFEKV
ncbi:MAG: cyclic-di-AMP receptor [Clostridiales bacterium]|nr:cyclic-di-AMP receptor [Clostridiales bacterium]MDD7309615.1 cyclic-di-AMP receptor [Eubacteriales bacterium]MDY5347125.1 cyclic-di-AMP receptor [Eubacteriales bacterium]